MQKLYVNNIAFLSYAVAFISYTVKKKMVIDSGR